MKSILEYRLFSIAGSVLLAVVLFATTFGGYNGFASSLTFDGGLRLVVQLPDQYGDTEIQEAMRKQNLPIPLTRPSNPRLNIWDIEFDEAQKQKIQATMLGSTSNDVLINEMIVRLLDGLDNVISEDAIVATEILSASYGENLLQLATKILLYTIIGIGSYLAFRFSFAFSLGAIVALFHDFILTLGFIGAMQIKPSIPVLAAVLTLLGYSINDTIVIFDRIRENKGKNELSPTVVNMSVVQTLSRTIVTAILTLLSVIALWFSGESSLRDFSVIMIWGVIIGTYSSIMIAAPVTYDLQKYLKKRMASQKK